MKEIIGDNNVKILGAKISCCNFEYVLQEMDKNIKNGAKGCIGITNSESIYYARKIFSHRQYIENNPPGYGRGQKPVVAVRNRFCTNRS